jgi:hypothetical protein
VALASTVALFPPTSQVEFVVHVSTLSLSSTAWLCDVGCHAVLSALLLLVARLFL